MTTCLFTPRLANILQLPHILHATKMPDSRHRGAGLKGPCLLGLTHSSRNVSQVQYPKRQTNKDVFQATGLFARSHPLGQNAVGMLETYGGSQGRTYQPESRIEAGNTPALNFSPGEEPRPPLEKKTTTHRIRSDFRIRETASREEPQIGEGCGRCIPLRVFVLHPGIQNKTG